MKPRCLQTGPQDFVYTFEDEAMVVEAQLIEDNHHGYNVEFFLHTLDGMPVDRFTLNLMAQRTRNGVADALKKTHGGNVDWRVGFKDILFDMIARTRAGEAIEDMALGDASFTITYLVGPTLKRDGLTLFYGNFAEGKTLLAYVHAICVAYPELRARAPSPFITHDHGPVLILDYEMKSAAKMAMRCLLRGFGLESIPGRIFIKPLDVAFVNTVRGFREFVRTQGIKLVVLDSQDPAMRRFSDGDPALPIRELSEALRSLHTTNLMIGQVAKEEARRDGSREPYGSRMVSYQFDDTYEIRGRKNPLTKQLVSVMHHRKHRGPDNPPMAFSVDFPPKTAPGVYRVNGIAVPEDDPELLAGEPTKRDRVWAAIGSAKASYEEIAQRTGLDQRQVGQICRDLETAGKVRRVPGEGTVYRT